MRSTPPSLRGSFRGRKSPLNLCVCVCVCCLFRGCFSCAPETTVVIVTVSYVFGLLEVSSMHSGLIRNIYLVCLKHFGGYGWNKRYIRTRIYFQMENKTLLMLIFTSKRSDYGRREFPYKISMMVMTGVVLGHASSREKTRQ